jgi:hypothetical protein
MAFEIQAVHSIYQQQKKNQYRLIKQNYSDIKNQYWLIRPFYFYIVIVLYLKRLNTCILYIFISDFSLNKYQHFIMFV